MFNASSIVEYIGSKSINHFKLDSKGHYPLYYAIISNNSLLVETLFETVQDNNKKKVVIEHKDNFGKIAKDYANSSLQKMYVKIPNYEDQYKIHLNKVLGIAIISNTVPIGYENLCKIEFKLGDIDIFVYPKEKHSIHKYKELIEQFEKKYEKKSKDNVYYTKLIEKCTENISKLCKEYHSKLLNKYIKSSSNFSTVYDAEDTTELENTIKTYTDAYMEDTIRLFFMIKNGDDDVLPDDGTPIEDFLMQLTEEIVGGGLIQPNSDIHKGIKQFINVYMNELISKTLNFIQATVDISHRWWVNYYNALLIVEKLNEIQSSSS